MINQSVSHTKMLTTFHETHKINKNWWTHDSVLYIFAGSSWQHTCLPCPDDEESLQVVYKEGENVSWTLWAVTSGTVVIKRIHWPGSAEDETLMVMVVERVQWFRLESPSLLQALLSSICQEQGYILAGLVISGCVSLYDVYIKATHARSMKTGLI